MNSIAYVSVPEPCIDRLVGSAGYGESRRQDRERELHARTDDPSKIHSTLTPAVYEFSWRRAFSHLRKQLISSHPPHRRYRCTMKIDDMSRACLAVLMSLLV